MAGAFLAVRKYIPVFGNLRLYAELEGGGQWGTLKQVYTETYGGSEDAENLKFKLSNWNVNLSPGLAYTVAGKFTITASIGNVGYFKDTEKDKNNGRSSSISGFDCDFSTFFSGFGVSFKL